VEPQTEFIHINLNDIKEQLQPYYYLEFLSILQDTIERARRGMEVYEDQSGLGLYCARDEDEQFLTSEYAQAAAHRVMAAFHQIGISTRALLAGARLALPGMKEDQQRIAEQYVREVEGGMI
jgi:hypothetical protein